MPQARRRPRLRPRPASACAPTRCRMGDLLESRGPGLRRQTKGEAMAIRYGCFFSYAHGRHELMQRFKTTLADALRCYLEPHFDNEDELFVDTDQLGGGDDIDRKIARAMCESACMVLIYTPKYEAHAYTR